MTYKTKAVRKAARWAKKGSKGLHAYRWFKQLVHTQGWVHAVAMVKDAEKAPSFYGYDGNPNVMGVVVWSETSYNRDWMASSRWDY